MKRLIVIVLLMAAASVSQLAHATVWWPEVMGVTANITVYRDYQDENLFYYVPKGVTVATNDKNVKMINHEIFFNRLNPSQSATQYNLTFEPLLGDDQVRAAQQELVQRFGSQAKLAPMPVTTMNFEVTQKYDNHGTQYSSPFSVFVPNWTGDLHSFNQRFSVVMIGNAYMSEPTMGRFMTNPAGNAFVGILHYGFRGVQVPFKGHATVNVHQFISRLKAQLSARVGFWASADISTAIDKIKDDRSVFIDVVKDAGYESEVWKSLMAKLVELVFEPMPTPPSAPQGSDTGFALFKIKASYESVELDRTITVDLREAIVKDHTGDIDIVGGGVVPTQLSSNLKYLCDMWAKFDAATQSCRNVCEQGTEFYSPATRSCLPAFGAK